METHDSVLGVKERQNRFTKVDDAARSAEVGFDGPHWDVEIRLRSGQEMIR